MHLWLKVLILLAIGQSFVALSSVFAENSQAQRQSEELGQRCRVGLLSPPDHDFYRFSESLEIFDAKGLRVMRIPKE